MDLIFTDVGAGPTLILLHGFPFNRSMWREQVEFLSADEHGTAGDVQP